MPKEKKLGGHRRQVFEAMLYRLGHVLRPEKVEDLYRTFELRLAAITTPPVESVPELFKLVYLSTASGTGTIPTATVMLDVPGLGPVREAAWGKGPIDAAYNAIQKAVGIPIQLEDYSSRSATRGQDAVGEVTVSLSSGGHTAIGRGASTDLIEAGARAFVDGLNRLAHQGAFVKQPVSDNTHAAK